MQTLTDAIREHLWGWLIAAGVVLGLAAIALKDFRDGRRTRVTEDDGRTLIKHVDHARTVHRIDPRYGGGDTSGGASSAPPG